MSTAIPSDVLLELMWRCCPRELAKLEEASPQVQKLLADPLVWCALVQTRHGVEAHRENHPFCRTCFLRLSSLTRSAADVIQEALPWETRLPSAHWASPVVCGRLLGFDAKPLSVTFSAVPPGRYALIWRLTVPFAMAPVVFFMSEARDLLGRSLAHTETFGSEEMEVDLLEITLCQDRSLRSLPPPFVVPVSLSSFSTFNTGFKAREGHPGPQIAFVELYDVELYPLRRHENGANIRLLTTGLDEAPDRFFASCANGKWQGGPPNLIWTKRFVRCSRFGCVAHVRSARLLRFTVTLRDVPRGRYALSVRQWQLFYPREYQAQISLTVSPHIDLTFRALVSRAKSSVSRCEMLVSKTRVGENEYAIGEVDLLGDANDVEIGVADTRCEVHGVVFDYFCLSRLPSAAACSSTPHSEDRAFSPLLLSPQTSS